MATNLEQQRQQLEKLNAEIANLKVEQGRLRQQSKGGLLKKPDLTSPVGQKIATDLANKNNEIKVKQKEYNDLKKIFDTAKSDSEVVSEIGSQDEIRKAAEAGFKPDQIQEYRDDVKKQLDAKKLEKQTKDQVKVDEVNSQELQNELANAGKAIAKDLDKQGRIDLATQLNRVYGLNLPLNGFYSPALKSAYTQMLADKFQRSLDEGRTISIGEFLEIGTKEGTYKKTGAGNVPTINISDPTEAAGYVRSVFKSLLQRDPTADEIAKFSDVLNKAERKSPRKTVNGVTTGGLANPIEFLTVEIQKLPEFSTKKKEKESLTAQSLQSIAKANGVVLSDAQLSSYADEISNGKDINVIKNTIRNSAGLGMPDNIKKMLADGTDLETIYAPYKNTMASLLELDPKSIDINDTTLRTAIGDKELPIYEFRKILKKDPRWQYTNNARAEVSDKVLRVLQDFGFQG
jgi:ribosomal protein L29